MSKRKSKSPDRLLSAGAIFQGDIVTIKAPEHASEIKKVTLESILQDRGEVPASCVLNASHARKMLERLRRYGKQSNPLGESLEAYLAAQGE